MYTKHHLVYTKHHLVYADKKKKEKKKPKKEKKRKKRKKGKKNNFLFGIFWLRCIYFLGFLRGPNNGLISIFGPFLSYRRGSALSVLRIFCFQPTSPCCKSSGPPPLADSDCLYPEGGFCRVASSEVGSRTPRNSSWATQVGMA